MDNTRIEWADATWNALRGCSKVSAGCAGCYAEDLAARFSEPGQWGHGLAVRGKGWTGKVVLDEKALLKPLRWKKPRRVFVTSIGDPFHPAVTVPMLDRLFAMMAMCPQHTFQLLTKRPQRMRDYLLATYQRIGPVWHVSHAREKPLKDGSHPVTIVKRMTPLSNVWLGVSVENQAAAEAHIPHLLDTPAALHFVSCEPLLGPVYLRPWLASLGWVIAGGESGRKARPMHPDWPRWLRDQCADTKVPFLFKQWGEWLPEQDAYDRSLPCITGGPGAANGMYRVGKKAAGRHLDGQIHHAFPEVANA